jgi:hypothetical protein
VSEARAIFATADRQQAEAALGQTFLVGAIPYVATEVVPVDRREWEVRGVRQDPHPPPPDARGG